MSDYPRNAAGELVNASGEVILCICGEPATIPVWPGACSQTCIPAIDRKASPLTVSEREALAPLLDSGGWELLRIIHTNRILGWDNRHDEILGPDEERGKL